MPDEAGAKIFDIWERKPGERMNDSRPPLRLVFFDEIQPQADVDDFVQGTLIRSTSVLVFGATNAGKTFWMTDLALHVAAGLPWQGLRVDQGGVVYVVLEGIAGFNNRVHAWKAKHGFLGKRIPFVAIQEPLDLRDPEADTDRLVAAIHAAAQALGVPVVLVVIDTMSRAMAGGNENSPDDMGALVANLDRIKDQTGACIASIHHPGKDETKGARGHSLLKAAVDTEIEVRANEETGERTATITKQRHLPKGQTYGFKLATVEIGQNKHGEPVTTCIVEPAEVAPEATAGKRKLPNSERLALDILQDAIAEHGEDGHQGVPDGLRSIPGKWWRERFNDRAMADATQDTKNRAFKRACQGLQARRLIGIHADRVWIA